MSYPSSPPPSHNDAGTGAPPPPYAPTTFGDPSQIGTAPQQGGYQQQGDYHPGYDSNSYGQGPYGAGPAKSFITTWILSMLLGGLGADRFYLGKIGTGVAKLLTGGGLGIWSIVDLIIVLTGNARDKDGRLLEGYPEHKAKAWIITGAVWVLGIIVGAMSMMMSLAALGIAAEQAGKAVASQSAAARDTTDETSTAPTNGAKGTPAGENEIVVTMSDGNTAKVTVNDALYTKRIASQPDTVPANGGFLLLEVTWETLTGTTSPNAFKFDAVSPSGKTGEVLYLNADEANLPFGKELATGQKVHGIVTWDIDYGKTEITVKDDIGDETATFSITPQAPQ